MECWCVATVQLAKVERWLVYTAVSVCVTACCVIVSVRLVRICDVQYEGPLSGSLTIANAHCARSLVNLVDAHILYTAHTGSHPLEASTVSIQSVRHQAAVEGGRLPAATHHDTALPSGVGAQGRLLYESCDIDQ